MVSNPTCLRRCYCSSSRVVTAVICPEKRCEDGLRMGVRTHTVLGLGRNDTCLARLVKTV